MAKEGENRRRGLLQAGTGRMDDISLALLGFGVWEDGLEEMDTEPIARSTYSSSLWPMYAGFLVVINLVCNGIPAVVTTVPKAF